MYSALWTKCARLAAKYTTTSTPRCLGNLFAFMLVSEGRKLITPDSRLQIHEVDSGADQHGGGGEGQGQRFAKQGHTGHHAEDRREEREHREARREVVPQQPEPGEVAGESDDDALVGEGRDHQGRELGDTGLA